jgi:hypothetical protein
MCGDLGSVCGGYGWLLTVKVRVPGPKWEDFPRVCARDTNTDAMYYFNIQLTILRIMWVPSSLSPHKG